MTIWDCRTHVRMTSMTSSVERTDLDFKISVALLSNVRVFITMNDLYSMWAAWCFCGSVARFDFFLFGF